MEAMHEVHNRIAANVAQRLIREIPDITNRLIALESIVVAILWALPLKDGADKVALEILRDRAGERLAGLRLEQSPAAGEA